MFETLGKPMSNFYDGFSRMADLESDFMYGQNAPVMEFTSLLNDLANMSDELSRSRCHNIYGIYGYPRHGYAESYSQHLGWSDTILRLMEEPDIADKLLDDDYLANIDEMGSDEQRELAACARAARNLTKKQMIELIPKVCAYTLDYYKLLGAFECTNELLKEIHEQNERLQLQQQKQVQAGGIHEES